MEPMTRARPLTRFQSVRIEGGYGKKIDIPDFVVSIGDKITVKSSEKSKKRIRAQLDTNPNYSAQGWLQLDIKAPSATIVALPTRQDVQLPIEEQLVVEFCSK